MKRISRVQRAWKNIVNSGPGPQADSVAMFLILKAFYAKSNDRVSAARELLKMSFTPISNLAKLTNGMKEYQGLDRALAFAKMEVVYSKMNGKPVVFGDITIEGPELADLISFVKDVVTEKFDDPNTLYIVTQQDMSYEQQLVQTAHVAFCAGQSISGNNSQDDGHGLTFIVYSAKDSSELDVLIDRMIWKKQPITWFREPDQGGALTSVAIGPMRRSFAESKKFFKDMKLLTLPVTNLEQETHAQASA